MLDAENISFSYGKNEALKNISAQLREGELTFLIGPNGSGKSTFLRLLAGIDVPGSGKICIDGKSYSDFSSRELAKKVSFMAQERKIPDMSVYEYVSCGRYPYRGFWGRFSREDEKAVECALKKTNTESFSQRALSSLSGGERQRVYIAMLLCRDTPYILLDEPTTFLDISHSFEIMELLKTLRNNGKGIISVVHDVSMALEYADRIMLLDRGKLLLDSPPDYAAQSKELERTLKIKCRKAEIDGKAQYFFSLEKK